MTVPGFALLVLLAFVAVVIFLELAAIPGKKARERGHTQADAINVLGWVGLPMGGVPWVVALVWAYTNPGPLTGSAPGGGVDPVPESDSSTKEP